MTTVQMPSHQATSAPAPVVHDIDAAGPRVSDDMTVEVALSVMAVVRVQYLVVCDGDDESTGSVTRAQLTRLRDSSAYTDRIRLRDLLGGHPVGPFSFSL